MELLCYALIAAWGASMIAGAPRTHRPFYGACAGISIFSYFLWLSTDHRLATLQTVTGLLTTVVFFAICSAVTVGLALLVLGDPPESQPPQHPLYEGDTQINYYYYYPDPTPTPEPLPEPETMVLMGPQAWQRYEEMPATPARPRFAKPIDDVPLLGNGTPAYTITQDGETFTVVGENLYYWHERDAFYTIENGIFVEVKER